MREEARAELAQQTDEVIRNGVVAGWAARRAGYGEVTEKKTNKQAAAANGGNANAERSMPEDRKYLILQSLNQPMGYLKNILINYNNKLFLVWES